MSFREDLEYLINRYSMENESNTPDYILVRFIMGCLNALNHAVKDRDKWYHKGEIHCPGKTIKEAMDTVEAIENEI